MAWGSLTGQRTTAGHWLELVGVYGCLAVHWSRTRQPDQKSGLVAIWLQTKSRAGNDKASA